MTGDLRSFPAQRRRDVLRLAAVAGLTLADATPSHASSQKSAAPLDVDLSKIPAGSGLKLVWHSQPLFVRHLTPAEIAAAQSVDRTDLRDPQTLDERTKPGHRDWLVVIGVCPHLGCKPLGAASGEPRGSFGGFVCPCHGSTFDTAGRVKAGPAPTNLEVPDYRFLSETIIRLGA